MSALVSCYFKFCVLFLFLGHCLVNGKHYHVLAFFFLGYFVWGLSIAESEGGLTLTSACRIRGPSYLASQCIRENTLTLSGVTFHFTEKGKVEEVWQWTWHWLRIRRWRIRPSSTKVSWLLFEDSFYHRIIHHSGFYVLGMKIIFTISLGKTFCNSYLELL